MAFPVKEINNLVRSGYPLIYLVSWEEERIENNLKLIARKYYGEDFKVYVWSCDNKNSIEEALDIILKSSEKGFFIFKDIEFFIDKPGVIRKLKDLYISLKYQTNKSIFFISPDTLIPKSLEKEVTIIDVGLPDINEAEQILDSVLNNIEFTEFKNNLTPEIKDVIANSLLGLGKSEMELALKRSLYGKSSFDEKILEDILEEKAQLVRKTGTLEFIREIVDIDNVGGLSNLKDWLDIRSLAFTSKAKEFGLDRPKGVLVMGISGCGKSLCCKAIANKWNLPLLRLDLNQVYSGISGTPEEAFRKAIKTVEAAAPCVLWIDEIEAGLARSGEKTSDSPVSRIFGYFLTWLQEKNVPVFIAATANQIDLLPPEVLRKGRFDEIFFVTLPAYNERREIFEIHLKQRGKNPSNYDLSSLAKNTEGMSGAEIEQAVISALFESFSKEKDLDDRELIIATSSLVPLSTTMREEISRLERWASDRAVKASKS